MKLAVNYSPQAAGLLAAGQVRLDLYKCADWPEMVADARRQRPAYVHFPLMAGRHDLGRTGIDKIRGLLAGTATPFVNAHLAPRAADFGIALETHDPQVGEQLFRAMMRDIDELRAIFGPEHVILENANWDPNYDIPPLVLDPAMISRTVTESGCGFLLDVSHARMAAAYLQVDVRAYIAALPVEHLRELHISGTEYVAAEHRLVDHFPMTEPDWSLTEWALDQIGRGEWAAPWVVTLEYGGVGNGFSERSRSDVLARDLPRLQGLIEAAARARMDS